MPPYDLAAAIMAQLCPRNWARQSTLESFGKRRAIADSAWLPNEGRLSWSVNSGRLDAK